MHKWSKRFENRRGCFSSKSLACGVLHQDWTMYLKMAVKLNVDKLILSLFRDEEGGERVELDESESNDSEEDEVGMLRVALNVRRRRSRRQSNIVRQNGRKFVVATT